MRNEPRRLDHGDDDWASDDLAQIDTIDVQESSISEEVSRMEAEA
jgi:hypothetical protein